MSKIEEFSNGELTVVWRPERCCHAGICIRMLPQVYRPGDRPWIHLENATSEQLMAQIDRCPSGALNYRWDS